MHLITDWIARELESYPPLTCGICHLFLLHTSASLAINENADPEVRVDLESHFDLLAPENAPHYTHNYEGPDDMPAHIKTMLIGPSLTIPITDGQLKLGMWQGIYLCEHRSHAGPRQIVMTAWGAVG
ncbi:MAG: YjbQ family protein [Anaerolineales bacterium]|nr:YjbQ family protein [Anaerolineales bacterium]